MVSPAEMSSMVRLGSDSALKPADSLFASFFSESTADLSKIVFSQRRRLFEQMEFRGLMIEVYRSFQAGVHRGAIVAPRIVPPWLCINSL